MFSLFELLCFNNKVQMLRVGHFQAEFADKSQAESVLFLYRELYIYILNRENDVKGPMGDMF